MNDDATAVVFQPDDWPHRDDDGAHGGFTGLASQVIRSEVFQVFSFPSGDPAERAGLSEEDQKKVQLGPYSPTQ